MRVRHHRLLAPHARVELTPLAAAHLVLARGLIVLDRLPLPHHHAVGEPEVVHCPNPPVLCRRVLLRPWAGRDQVRVLPGHGVCLMSTRETDQLLDHVTLYPVVPGERHLLVLCTTDRFLGERGKQPAAPVERLRRPFARAPTMALIKPVARSHGACTTQFGAEIVDAHANAARLVEHLAPALFDLRDDGRAQLRVVQRLRPQLTDHELHARQELRRECLHGWDSSTIRPAEPPPRVVLGLDLPRAARDTLLEPER